jgi:hypothetical protein
LIASCRVAPYGKGTRTLVNKQVRNTFELDPKKFRLSDAWNSPIAAVTKTVAERLGLPADQLEARAGLLIQPSLSALRGPSNFGSRRNGDCR